MKEKFFTLRQLTAFRAFLMQSVLRYMVGEILFLCAERLPFARLKLVFLQFVLALNPMHIPAALERAQMLAARRDPAAVKAFEHAQGLIENRARVSASDLALTRVPERVVRRFTRREDAVAQQARWQAMYLNLAQTHLAQGKQEPTRRQEQKKRDASDATAEPWSRVESAWLQGRVDDAFRLAAPLCARGDFVSPLDAVTWAERALGHERFELAEQCLQWAQAWTPERAGVWKLRAALASVRGERAGSASYLERAACLNPEDVTIFLAGQNLGRAEPLRPSATANLRVKAPLSLAQDGVVQAECVVENASGVWNIHVLSPAGWGIAAMPRTQPMDAQQRAVVFIRACRPDRVRGAPWTVTFVATNHSEYLVACVQIAVADATRGKILLVVTEDHELWEERGVMTRGDIDRLLVEKSKFAADRFAPWTHMVEVGSALALLDWSAKHDAAWIDTRDRVREHLTAQVQGGNDIQPHLHAFNLPSSPEFPYHLTGEGIAADKQFLLTPEEKRRDFARAYPPCERIAAVADAVARLERLAHAADPTYRAVVWRSGQLEFGETDAERAWSSIALLRAGLIADSDVPKKTFALQALPRPAFFAAIEKPFEPHAGGELVQLPVTGNLEGDFLSDARTLRETAKRTGKALQNIPGVHVITLLTHDKFINARRGGDEFRLDANYNEWETIRAHLDAWQDVGAERVLARHALQALLDDRAWRLTAWLTDETWLAETRVRYTIQLLGQGIPVSDEYPQWVLVTIPPFLRTKVARICVWQGDCQVTRERNSASDFWLRICARTPTLYCELE